MRSLVIYDSKYGNTERVARAIAEGLGERGEAHAVVADEVGPAELEAAQFVVVGAPTQIKSMSLAMRRFLRRHRGDTRVGQPVAVFDTQVRADPKRSGSAEALAGRLARMGAVVIARPESFFVTGMQGTLEDGEIGRATVWGRRLHLADRVVAEGD